MGVAAKLALVGALALALALPAAPAVAAPAAAAALEETRGAVSVDWGEGTVTARAGAAADLRMPSADLARPGAERRARAAALIRLKEALAALPLGGGRALGADAVDRALGHAQLVDVEYQSNGGAVVRLRVRFGDWLAADPAPGPALSVPEAHLAAAPALRVGSKEVVTGVARYRVGAPPAGTHATTVKIDHDGRWVAHREKGDPDFTERLAGAAIVIYVQKVLR